jgi:hypothetical protein
MWIKVFFDFKNCISIDMGSKLISYLVNWFCHVALKIVLASWTENIGSEQYGTRPKHD